MTDLHNQKKLAEHYFYSSIANCKLMNTDDGQYLAVSTVDGTLTLLRFLMGELMIVKKIEIESSGEFVVDSKQLVLLDDDTLVRYTIAEWKVQNKINHDLDKPITSFAVSGEEIICGTNGDNLR